MDRLLSGLPLVAVPARFDVARLAGRRQLPFLRHGEPSRHGPPVRPYRRQQSWVVRRRSPVAVVARSVAPR